MTLLVVLGVVVIATILAALYLSLKSGRGNEPTSDDAGAGDRLVRGGSRSGRSASLAGRMRSVADRGKAARPSRRRSGDDDDYEVPDYVTARRAARSARGGERSSLVTTGTGQRTADGRPAAGFDDTDAAPHTGYGQSAAGYDEYDGYDAAADTRVSGPMTGPMTGPMSSERSERPRGYRDRAGERGRDADSSRGRYPGSAREGTGGENFPPADRYSPASFPGDRRDTEPGERPVPAGMAPVPARWTRWARRARWGLEAETLAGLRPAASLALRRATSAALRPAASLALRPETSLGPRPETSAVRRAEARAGMAVMKTSGACGL